MNPQQQAAADAIVDGLAKETNRAKADLIAFGTTYGPRAAQMAAEGATEADFKVLADVVFGELCVQGIMAQAAGERALKQVFDILVAAGRTAVAR